MLEIRAAKENEYEAVRSFYHSLIDAIPPEDKTVGWIKDVYPSPEYLKSTIGSRRLFIGFFGGEIAAAMVVNGEFNESYNDYDWPTKAAPGEIAVIHALGVHSKWARRGFAKELVAFASELSLKEGKKVIRLDVLNGNTAAMRLYEGSGFKYLHTLKMFYEDTGWTEFLLYEKIL